MSDSRVAYDFAVVRLTPGVHLGAAVNVGVLLHARTVEYLGARIACDPEWIARVAPDVDARLVARYLKSWLAVAGGADDAGPLGLLPASERFHWLTAPRSDLLHCSPVHVGLSDNPAASLDTLYDTYVPGGPRPDACESTPA